MLRVEGLRTHFATDEGIVKAVDGVDLAVPHGRTVCVVGESGCGKSVTARSILGLIDSPGRIVDGNIWWQSDTAISPIDLTTLDPRGEPMRGVRGGQIGMVFQEPMASLSPLYTVGDQLIETIRLHQPLSEAEAREKAISDLARVGIPRPERRVDAYPFQLSGGMNQRVMIAIALSCDPALLIADEPTTALDVTTQAQILDLLADLRQQTGLGMLFITHDLGVVAEIADEVVVMYLGSVVEQGAVDQVFDDPQHPYTQALLASVPRLGTGGRSRVTAISGMVPHPANRPAGCPFHPRCPSAMPGLCDVVPPAAHVLAGGQMAACHLHDPDQVREPSDDEANRAAHDPPGRIGTGIDRSDSPRLPHDEAPLLSVRSLRKVFPIKHGLFGRSVGQLPAVNDVSLDILPGETLGLVGESGCGKTTLGRCIARAIAPTSGEIRYSRVDGELVDLAKLSARELRRYRGQIRVIFQDPFSSLNPRMTLLQIIAEPLRERGRATRPDSSMRDQVAEMLRRVGLRPEYMRRYPHAFSGGERQRVNIARALITNPRLVIADEAVSALDVSVRAQILNLLRDLQDELGLTYLFISHDMSVIEHLCDRVAVMYLGRIVEQAKTADLFSHPQHPYTEALLSAVPRPDPRQRRTTARVRLAGEIPDPSDPPSGCPFHTRCPHRRPERCDTDLPLLAPTDDDSHEAACHYALQLSLAGAPVATDDASRAPAPGSRPGS